MSASIFQAKTGGNLRIVALAVLFLAGGCAIIRYVDYGMPAVRFDRPINQPLPARSDPAVQAALDTWRAMSAAERQRYPTAYHVYVDTSAPGTQEGDHTIGIAFSGGGTRGTVFGAACIRELLDLGPIAVHRPDGDVEIDLVDEADYVSGVSTGAIPAALLALNYGDSCPPATRLERWPDCFNVDVQGLGLRHIPARPDLLLRDLTFGMNTRHALSGAIAAAFFEGKTNRPASGLTFGDLPAQPVLIIGATIVNDPGASFMQTRLPYRFALDQEREYPWQVGVQSFETLHSDPLSYPLGDASAGSSSFPGHLRSVLMRVQEDRPWVYEGLDEATAGRMRAARNQEGYTGVYDVKDGGLVDNRGSYVLHRIFERLEAENPPAKRPLLVCLDAGYLELRPTRKGAGILKKGWMNELQSSMRTSWQTGQDAYNAWMEATAEQGVYDYVRFRFTAWVHYMASETEADGSPEGQYLRALCEGEPLIGTPARLVETLRQLNTTFSDLPPEQMAGTILCARFAVWLEKDRLLQWASEQFDGAEVAFANDLKE